MFVEGKPPHGDKMVIALPESSAGAAGSPQGGQADLAKESGNMLGTDTLWFLFWGILPFLIILMLVFECIHRRWANVDFEEPLDYRDLGRKQPLGLLCLWEGAWGLARPYCTGPGAPFQGRAYGLALVGMSLFDLFIAYCFNVWQSAFWNAFEAKKTRVFAWLVVLFFLIVFSMIIIGTYQSYVLQMLNIHWRTFMTKRFQEKWLQNQAFYKVQIDQRGLPSVDNPDQRIQEDISKFVSSFLDLAFGFLSAVGYLVVFVPVLTSLSPNYILESVYCPGWILYALVGFAILGSICSHLIGKQLVNVNFAMQRYEADYRYRVIQVRDNSEQIALSRAERSEEAGLDERFAMIKRVWWESMDFQKRLAFFTSMYQEVTFLLPFFLLAPTYFAGKIEMGVFFRIQGAATRVNGSLQWAVSNYQVLTDFRATVVRLKNFWEVMEETSKLAVVQQQVFAAVADVDAAANGQEAEAEAEGGPAFLAEGICSSLPGPEGKALWRDAELRVEPGESVLLCAPEGSGKSCFLRAVAGIWPHGARGCCRYRGEPFFVPQRPYIPQGELRQAVAFPSCASQYRDDAVARALTLVGLSGKLPLDRLGERANWGAVLSGGEQQRLAVARVLLARPFVLFLDEATSSVGAEGARELYGLLLAQLPKGASIVSISHQVDILRPLHNKCYEISGRSGEAEKGSAGLRWIATHET